jgi:hypothetical protein
MNFLIALSENDKRLIFAILIVLILVFVLIGYIGFLVTKVMKWQGKKLDTIVADPVVTRVITDKHHFVRYARKKNWRLFFKQSYIAILILLFAAIILIIRDAIYRDFSYNPFNKDNGFGTLLFVWDFSVCFRREGISLILNWPALVNTPHFVWEAWGGYLFTIALLIGGIWYIIALQALIARTIRMFQLATSAFEKSLDGFNQNVQYQQQQQNTVPPQPDNNMNNQ